MTARPPIAALDVGSNTIRMLVAKAAHGRLERVDDRSAFVRLGKGVDSDGQLQHDRMRAALAAINDLMNNARSVGVETIIVVATSAVRDARNGRDFAAQVSTATGLNMRILSGDEEAHLTALGALTDLDQSRRPLVCDLGGGSAELIAVSEGNVMWGRSIPLGSGRLTERFIHHDPPTGEEIEAVVQHVDDALSTLPSASPDSGVLTGGTATHVAWLAGHQEEIARVSPDELIHVRDVVNCMPARSIIAKYGVKPERAEVLSAGITALAAIIAHYDLPQVVVTQRGIREGVIVDYLQREGVWPSSRR